MAITKEQVIGILNGEADAEAKATSLIETFSKDFEEEKNKIILNREDIKNEKKAEIEKRHAVEVERDQLKTQIGDLQKQLQDNSPENIQKFYDQKLTDQQNVFDGQLKDIRASLEEKTKEVEELKKVQFRSQCMEQFNKAIVGKNISPDMLDDFSLAVLGPDCCKFAERSLGEAGNQILTSEGQTIESVVKAKLDTPFGKACQAFKSSGGSAEGGTGRSGSGDKTISRSAFDAKNPFERQKLMADGYKIV